MSKWHFIENQPIRIHQLYPIFKRQTRKNRTLKVEYTTWATPAGVVLGLSTLQNIFTNILLILILNAAKIKPSLPSPQKTTAWEAKINP